MSLVTSEKTLAAVVTGQPCILGLSSLTCGSINHWGSITNPSSGETDVIRMVPFKE